MKKYYSRQEKLIDNKKLSKKKALIIGLGSLGCTVSNHLVRAGVGEIIIVDDDVVEESNLNRQILYDTNNIGRRKIIVARKKLKKINKNIKITGLSKKFNKNMLDGVDLVFDCVDKYNIKKEINKECFNKRVPLVFGSADEYYGMTSLFIPGKTLCLNCLSKKASHSGQTISPVPGMVGSIQAVEGLKYLNNKGVLLMNKLLYIDLLNNSFEIISIKKKKDCSVCQNV